MIEVYYGPVSGFVQIIENETNFLTLLELAVKRDAENRKHTFIVEGQPKREEQPSEREHISCLVAYSDEYASLSESAIQSITSLILSFEIDRIYLQNPPMYVVDQFKKLRYEVKEHPHEYKKIDLQVFTQFVETYDSEVLGQELAKISLATSLYPHATGKLTKPLVILLYGSTGVGKTETAKFLSRILGEELFRKQFSMFHNDGFADYLFGGRHSQNSLAKELLERESNIILFDEFDKPHPVFHSAFYQLFDEGVFEDKNYRVTLKDAIIICTSNYTSEQQIIDHLGAPIFSRFDALIKFEDLTPEVTQRIIVNEYASIVENLSTDEQSIVQSKKVKEQLLINAEAMKNFRHIRKIVREAVYFSIIRDMYKIM